MGAIAVLLYIVGLAMVFGGTQFNPDIGAYGLIVIGVGMLFHMKFWLLFFVAGLIGFIIGVRR